MGSGKEMKEPPPSAATSTVGETVSSRKRMKPASNNGQQQQPPPQQQQGSAQGRRPTREEELAREGVPVPRLQKTPHAGHRPESYEDMEDLEYPATLYSVMEQHLPSHCLGASREKKLAMLERILAKYRPNGERAKVNPNFKNQKSKFQSFMDFHKLNFVHVSLLN